MSAITLIGLIIISIIIILIDCYAGYALFLMTAMPIGHYLSPILLLFIVVSVPTIFITSIVGLFRLKKWAYYTFFIMTMLLHLFLIQEDLYLLGKKIIKALEMPQFIPIFSFLLFIIYFFRPSVRKMFNQDTK